MLTVSQKQVADQADQYFKKDMNYYLSGSQTLGYFHGKAALIMGLNKTQITPESYDLHTMLCNGQYGSKQLVTQGAGEKHVAGFDITMADPKDVSILRGYALCKNHPLAQKLQLAHDSAVANTLVFIERYAGCRITKDQQTKFIKSNNVIAAAFDHQVNRLDEIHNHTHNFIYNMVIDKNGEHRALENYYIFENQDLFHQTWHTNLALELHKIGLETQITDYRKGTFAIKGFNPTITKHYSSRTHGINEVYRVEEERLGRELTYTEKEPIKRLHRPQKSKRNIDEILSEFSEDIEERFAFDIDQLESYFNSAERISIITENELNAIIAEAADALNKKQACFSYEDLLKAVLSLTHGNNKTIPIDEIETAIDGHSYLIRFTDTSITTKAFYKLENDIIQKVMKGKNTFEPIFTEDEITIAISDKVLTIGQQEALAHILTTSDQCIGIQGKAGSGIRSMLKWAKELAGTDIEFQGLAFTGSAADELEKESGIKSTTIHDFLASISTPCITNQKKTLIIDEASMVSSKLLYQIIDRALSENAQIVMVGVIKPYQSISAGMIFSDLQQLKAMEFSHVPEVMRQTEESLICAVTSINMHLDYTKAFDIIDKYNMVKSIEDDETRLNAIVAAYFQSNQNETLMIASSNKERNAINHLVRNKMIETGVISSERQLDTLSAVEMSDIEKLFAQNYTLGQVVIANKQGILGRNGEQGIVINTDHKSNTINVEKSNNTIQTISLTKSASMISVFNHQKKKLGIGEQILFGRNRKKLNIENAQTGIITAINGDVLTIKKQQKSIAINLVEYPYFDYAYCILDVKAQGKSSKNVIVAANAQRSSHESFYVQLTRAKESLLFFVDDAVKFRIATESEKYKNSTLQKTIQRILNDRRTKHTRAVNPDKSNHAINQRNRPGYRADGAGNTEQYREIGESPSYNGCDLHNVGRPLQRVGWKLAINGFRGVFKQANESLDQFTGFDQHTQRRGGDELSLIFKERDDLIGSEIVKSKKFPL